MFTEGTSPLVGQGPLQTTIASLQGRPGERKQDVHLTCHFPAGRLSERGRGWPPASGNRSLQPGMSARFQQSAQSRFGSVAFLIVGPRWRKDRSTFTNRNKKSSTEISVRVSASGPEVPDCSSRAPRDVWVSACRPEQAFPVARWS